MIREQPLQKHFSAPLSPGSMVVEGTLLQIATFMITSWSVRVLNTRQWRIQEFLKGVSIAREVRENFYMPRPFFYKPRLSSACNVINL